MSPRYTPSSSPSSSSSSIINRLVEKMRGHFLSTPPTRVGWKPSDRNTGLEYYANKCSHVVGAQDVAINALWSKEDDRDVDEEFEHIRARRIAPNFQEKLERKFNDQTVHFEGSGHLFDPLFVSSKKYDLVTLSGQSRITEMMTGKSLRPFTHYADGTGTAAESASDTRLQAEHFRVSMLVDGFAEPAGSSAKFAGKMPYTAPTAVISEAGVLDSAIGGILLFRTVFPPEQRISHVQFTTFYTVSQTVSLISIT